MIFKTGEKAYNNVRYRKMKATFLESEGLYPQKKKPDPSMRNLALGILLQAFRDIVSPKKVSNKEWELCGGTLRNGSSRTKHTREACSGFVKC